MLEALKTDLALVRDSPELPNVICVAAIAGLLVIAKYYALTEDNEVYCILIGAFSFIFIRIWYLLPICAVMCPDKKLQWFANNKEWNLDDRLEVSHIVKARWEESYAHLAAANSTEYMLT